MERFPSTVFKKTAFREIGKLFFYMVRFAECVKCKWKRFAGSSAITEGFSWNRRKKEGLEIKKPRNNGFKAE